MGLVSSGYRCRHEAQKDEGWHRAHSQEGAWKPGLAALHSCPLGHIHPASSLPLSSLPLHPSLFMAGPRKVQRLKSLSQAPHTEEEMALPSRFSPRIQAGGSFSFPAPGELPSPPPFGVHLAQLLTTSLVSGQREDVSFQLQWTPFRLCTESPLRMPSPLKCDVPG